MTRRTRSGTSILLGTIPANLITCGSKQGQISAFCPTPSLGKSPRITRRIWLNATHLIEPLGVPEPRQSWTLCKRCHALLLIEMERSPILSPLRLRIAIGIVAADRSPYVYAPTHKPVSDRTWIIVMAWGFGIAMLLHLVLIVMLAFVSSH